MRAIPAGTQMSPKYVGVGQEGGYQGPDSAAGSSVGHGSCPAMRGELLEADEVDSTLASRGAA